MAVRRAAPFEDPEHDVLWQQGKAAVWYWSRARANDIASAADTRYRAEALFRGSIPADDGAELLNLVIPGSAATAGVEARVWRQGELRASRWWPQPPDPIAWQAFARGAGMDPATPPPDARDAPLQWQPIQGGGPASTHAQQIRAHLPRIATGAGLVVLALFAWQGASAARAAWEARDVNLRIELLSSRLDKIITAREQADAARARIDALLALRAPASQVRLLGEVRKLTPGDWVMTTWTQPSPELLEVTIRAENIDAASTVAAWEASPLLQEVRLAGNNVPGELTLQARLTPLQEQAR